MEQGWRGDMIGDTAWRVWAGAIGLCEYLSAKPEVVRGKRILDLGSGTGITGLVSSARCGCCAGAE